MKSIAALLTALSILFLSACDKSAVNCTQPPMMAKSAAMPVNLQPAFIADAYAFYSPDSSITKTEITMDFQPTLVDIPLDRASLNRGVKNFKLKIDYANNKVSMGGDYVSYPVYVDNYVYNDTCSGISYPVTNAEAPAAPIPRSRSVELDPVLSQQIIAGFQAAKVCELSYDGQDIASLSIDGSIVLGLIEDSGKSISIQTGWSTPQAGVKQYGWCEMHIDLKNLINQGANLLSDQADLPIGESF